MELGPQNHSRDVLSGPKFLMVVYMDPPGYRPLLKPHLLEPLIPFYLEDQKVLIRYNYSYFTYNPTY